MPMLIGCNYIPAYAGNQLEMWGNRTFDKVAIEKELALARSIGINCVRIYLHDLLYEFEKDSLYKNLDIFLDLCECHQIKVIVVFFDDCWNRRPSYPNKHQPQNGVHNSMWLQSPGVQHVVSKKRWSVLEEFISNTVHRYASDKRIIMWDVYNEPGNAGLGKRSGGLLQRTFDWTRAANPEQPVTSGIHAIKSVADIALANSDIVTFHHYAALPKLKRLVVELEKGGRPLICTEYMARSQKSIFKTHLPFLSRTEPLCTEST
ncbi:MAG: cellulase family glycosylhydrolase [Bacteroidetes bacterium]|nr:cellulase family glycosylhydrolase [Bacteroidota bacterium]